MAALAEIEAEEVQRALIGRLRRGAHSPGPINKKPVTSTAMARPITMKYSAVM